MTSSILRNILFSIGAILFLGSLVARFIVINGFVAHPASPDSSAGETIPYEVKGKTVYITSGEESETTAILVGEICGLLVLISWGALTVYRKK